MEQIFCKVYTKATILVILLPDGDDSIAKHRQAPFFSSLLESWKCNLMWINFSRQQKQQYCSGHKTQDSRLLKMFFRFLHRELSITDHTKYNQWMKKNITISLFICCELWLALACSTLLAAHSYLLTATCWSWIFHVVVLCKTVSDILKIHTFLVFTFKNVFNENYKKIQALKLAF